MVCALSDQYFHRQNLSPLVAGQLFPVVFQWVVGFIAGFMNITPAGWRWLAQHRPLLCLQTQSTG